MDFKFLFSWNMSASGLYCKPTVGRFLLNHTELQLNEHTIFSERMSYYSKKGLLFPFQLNEALLAHETSQVLPIQGQPSLPWVRA